jgi:replicative DNA helicase
MTLFTTLDPARSEHVGSYELIALAAIRGEHGLEASVQVSNGTVCWYGPVLLEDASALSGACAEISPLIKRSAAQVNHAFLQLVPKIEDGLRSALSGEPWADPVPFSNRVPPPFPLHCLPPWLRDMVIATAEALQVPADLPAMLTFPVLGTALAKKVTVCIRQGYFVPVNCYVMIGMESGERKSPAYRAMLAPIVSYERALIARVKLARASEAEATGQKDDSPLPTLFADDITTEQVPVLLEQNGERLAIFSDEGDSLDIMAGKYSKGVPNFGVYLKAWDGGTYKVNRGMRPSIYLEHPLLSIGLCLQPSVLRSLTETPAFRGRGLLGRFWYALPSSFMGTRKTIGTPIPHTVERSYQDHIDALLAIPMPERAEVLYLSTPAHELFVTFESALEPQLAPDGALRPIADWVAKLGGGVARLAGLLHMAGAERDNEQIGAATMKNAIILGRYLLEHARATFGAMSENPAVKDAQAVLVWLARKEIATFSQRDICRDNRSRFEHPDACLPALTTLLEHNWIRDVPRDPKRNGRPPKSMYEAHPEIGSRIRETSPPPEENGTVEPYAEYTRNPMQEPDYLRETPDDIPPDDDGGDWS